MKLPAEAWGHILDFVDGRSLIRASETCKKLNDIVDLHPKLINKLWLELRGDEVFEVIRITRRKYKSCVLRNKHAEWFKEEKTVEALTKLGMTVTAFALDNTQFESRKALVDTLRLFPHLRRLHLKRVTVKDEKGASHQCLNEMIHLPNLRDLYMVEFYPWICDLFGSSVNIKKLEGYLIKYFDDDPTSFENLMYRQRNLQKLRLGIFRRGRLFKDNRSNEAKFQLEKLLLDGAIFASSQHLLSFMKTQRKVKKLLITLGKDYSKQLDQLLFYNELMHFALTELPNMRTLSVYQNEFRFASHDFITNLPPNTTIEHLKITGEAVDIFKSLASILPNIKRLKYETFLTCSSVPPSSVINTLQKLESLTVNSFFIKSLSEIHIQNGKLQHFDFTARAFGDDFTARRFDDDDYDENFKIFLQRHRSLTSLRINIVSFVEHIYTSRALCEEIVANLTDLRELNIQHFQPDIINHEISFLVNNLKNLSKMEVSRDQFELVTSQTFDECWRNGVCIAVGK